MVGYRKFSLTVGIVVIATGVLLFHFVTSAEYVDLVKWVVGLYMGGNVGSKVADKVQKVTVIKE